MARVVTFDLTTDGITHAISEINRFKGDFLRACQEALRILAAEKGVKFATQRISYYLAQRPSSPYVRTGRLENSMRGYYDSGKGMGILYSNCWYAVFVEYGTGVVGAANPHPQPWSYDVNDHGTDGWYYIESGGKPHWTMGQPSAPFFYDTKQELKRIAPQVYRELFRTELG